MHQMYLVAALMVVLVPMVGVQKIQASPTAAGHSSTPDLPVSADINSFHDAPGFRHDPLNGCVDGLGNFSFGTCQRRWHNEDRGQEPGHSNDAITIVSPTDAPPRAIPEPTAVTLMLVGVGALILRRQTVVSIKRQ